MTDAIVKVKHVRAASLCTGGARRWFTSRGLDWNEFLTNGLPASVIGQFDDPIAARAIEEAEKDAANVG